MNSPKLSPPNADTPQLDTNDRRIRRWGWLLLLVGVGGFFAWAALAPLDQGVPAPGTVMVSGNRKTVQPLQGGLVAALHVREGQQVREGDVLVELDGTRARAELEMSRAQLIGLRATEARLVAEQVDRKKVEYPKSLLAKRDDPRAAQAMLLNSQLFATRRANLDAELGALRESVASQDAQRAALQQASAARQAQRKLLVEELRGQRDLVSEGFLPRNRVSEQERLLAQLDGQLAEDSGNLARLSRTIAELKLKIAQRQQEFQSEVESRLVDVQSEIAGIEQQILALEFQVRNNEVRSPADGVVVGLKIHTVGGVVQAGQPLMDVVPAEEPLRVEAKIPTNLIDKVLVGMQVDLMFVNFNSSTTPHIPGKVKVLGADALIDESTKMPFYPAQIEVTDEGMQLLKTNRIIPGMQVQIFVRTGERTLLNYLVKPLLDRMQPALTER